jgi:transposase InsO family protein
VSTKSRFPDFGFRKVRDYVRRFLHLKVSEGGVARVVKAMDLPAAAPPQKRMRRSEEPRRFERSRPGELWQSDITSYLLRRHHRRVYLTVFLDDFSRYVVAWSLQLHQRQELVSECLLDGIQRFGKPREVLTDQGRQYFAWRGKSGFQKLLVKEGIAHVVARTHHPQTLGKCERLWKTVGDELIDRAHPEDLEETRERLGHYFKHYNHFRPHQGIGGMTPADRFFGVEEAVRREVEGAQAENALRMALGERPRERSFLVGNLDGRVVTVRSGAEGLRIETQDMGDGIPVEETTERECDHDGTDHQAPTENDEEGETHDANAGGGVGAGSVGAGGGGGEEESPRDGGGDAVLLAGEDGQGEGGGGAEGDGVAAVAVEPDGGLGDGGGTVEAAADASGPGGLGGDGAASPRRVTGEGTRRCPEPGAAVGADAGPSGSPGGETPAWRSHEASDSRSERG